MTRIKPPSVIGLSLVLGILPAMLLLGLAAPARAAGPVGTGSPASCDEAALTIALSGGGLVTFNCGPAPVTITLTSQKVISSNTTIDGGGLVALDGSNSTRLLFVNPGVRLSLTRLALTRGGNELHDGGAVYNAGELVVSSSTFIDNAIGNSAAQAVPSGTSLTRHGGAIYSSGPLTITASRFTNNNAQRGGALMLAGAGLTATHISGSTFEDNWDEGFGGGAIYHESGPLTILDSTFRRNRALYGGAIRANGAGPVAVDGSTFHNNTAGGYAGALFVENTLSLTNSSLFSNVVLGQPGGGAGAVYADGPAYLAGVAIYSNTAPGYAGGISFYGGPVTVLDSDIYSNTLLGNFGFGAGVVIETREPAHFDKVRIYSNTVHNASGDGGGGLNVAMVPLTISNSAIYSNVILSGTAASGAGIGTGWGATLTVINTAIYNNHAPTGVGGGIHIASYGDDVGTTLTNVTISGNSALHGGGLAVSSAQPVTLTHVTIVSNTASLAGNLSGTVALQGSLLAFGGPGNCIGPVTSLGHNLEDANTCGLGATGDLTGTLPHLGSLALNGAANPGNLSHALLEGSPAIDAANSAACPAVDQRGTPRPQGPACDIGAYEFVELFRLYLPLVKR